MAPIRVCIIGAGSAGLAALRVLNEEPEFFSPVAFERRSESDGPGGMWNYQPEANEPMASAMYQNLVTNLPKEIMAYSGFAFSETVEEDGGRSFVSHQAVLNYLRRFATELNLLRFIRFNCQVVSVKTVANSNGWQVCWRSNVKDSIDEEDIFDAIIMCNGHYEKPNMPEMKAFSKFCGLIIHSCKYRSPLPFTDKRVVLLGGGNSGIDISVDLCSVAREVILCHRRPRLKSILPDNMRQCVNIKCAIGPRTLELEDETIVDGVDAIILCTGFVNEIDFLSKCCSVSMNEDGVIGPLYRQLFSIRNPTLSFIGLVRVVLPFQLFEQQSRLVAAHLAGRWKTPSEFDMMADLEEQWAEIARDKTRLPCSFHVLGDRQWAYHDWLTKQSQRQSVWPVIIDVYNDTVKSRNQDILNYRQMRYSLLDSKTFTKVHNNQNDDFK